MNFINKKILNTPFPLLISDISNDFLNKENESTICDEILELKQEKETEMVMGGRYRYLKNFFLKKNLCRQIFDYFNKQSTFNYLFNEIYMASNKFKLKDEYNIFIKKKSVISNRVNKLLPFFYKKKFYLDMDFSIAEKNYFREPHHDKRTRILSFLLYLNTTDIKSGGSLEIYEYKNKKKNYKDRFPKKDELNLFTKIKPEFGKFISFLTSPDSIHGVENFNPINNEKRIFLYGSYTSFHNVEWL